MNEVIANKDEYKTSRKISKRIFPSLYFYFKHLIPIVYRCNRLAVKGIYDDEEWIASSLDIMRGLEKSGINFHITGMNNLKAVEGPVVFVSNHMSILETFIFPSIIHPVKKIVFVMKEELVRFPVFGPVSAARDPILVSRNNPREDLMAVLNQGSERLARGKSVVIFPQRTRTQFLNPSSFNTLGIKLARRNNVPIIPVALVTDAWSNGKYLKDFGKIDPKREVKICFGEPIKISGNGSEEHQKVIDFIKSKFVEWGRNELIRE
ncbi:lysophospholipid acyltransferase family protein [Rosettibacter firmus]|uniref:lysophospholipid acyltransferase family protein n=1 Tax=Rosettibacter firmus TaxID=3111522 RepID=UPI00336C234F